MISNYKTLRNDDMLLKVAYEGQEFCSCVATTHKYITEDFEKNIAHIYVSKEVKDYYGFLKIVDHIINLKRRNYQIDVESFASLPFLSIEEVLRAFITRIAFFDAKLYSAKKETKKQNKVNLSLYLEDESYSKFAKKLITISENVTKTRNLQITPPNIATSEW
ncbi:Uncharacterised protein, partial [Metamycoplasma alkalescens]